MYLSEVYGEGGIYAKVVAASSFEGSDIPIYTLETRAPKFIDAEFEKHRMLSSNSSSSRAIPFKNLDELYIPISLRKKEKGMQGYSEHSLLSNTYKAFKRDTTILYKTIFDLLNDLYSEKVHKQHLNRYIEAWMFQKKVVTATEWDNFFKLRLAPDAQPEIQELARCMKKALDLVKGKETKLVSTAWHTPYVDVYGKDANSFNGFEDETTALVACSAARCARVSFMTHDNENPNVLKDLDLALFLKAAGHLTPFEHQATPMKFVFASTNNWEEGITHMDKKQTFWSANFKGWIQNRQLK